MKLIEALKIVQSSSRMGMEPVRIFLACGFTPLHLETFLAAALQARFPERRVIVETGIYGDILGNVERLKRSSADWGAVVLEWPDFHPALGVRQLGSWGPGNLQDIVHTVFEKSDLIQRAIEVASKHVPLAVCLPTLPLPPVSYTACRQASTFELQLRECLANFSVRIIEGVNVRIANSQRLDCLSPPGNRLDVKSELLSGFPYRLSHASSVAELLAGLIGLTVAKKGLITDLDDTLWSGILGEVGVRGISWDRDHHSQIHGLYQHFLRSLSDAGVLIGVASKNDPGLVDEAFRREDLLIGKENIFPVKATWGHKSECVAQILRAWNVGADSVVFVDDTPMELAEVQAAHPKMECILFPKDDDQAVYGLLERLRDLFGKEAISDEDAIRLESIRRSTALREDSHHHGTSLEHFLEQMEPEMSASFTKDPMDPRPLELVNKTNQFNLNGKRFIEGAWSTHLESGNTFLLSVSYKDKYGPLGKIAILTGRAKGSTLWIDVWVMSCRAFSRRIEHKCLDFLFRKFEAQDIIFDFEATERNGPLREFFQECLGNPPEPGFHIPRELFLEKCPPLYHRLTEIGHG